MRHSLLQPATVLSLMLAALVLMLAVDLLLHDTIDQIFREGHTIEFLAGVYYLVAAVLLVAVMPPGLRRSQWHLPVILVLMFLRELDMDKALTTDGVLQLRLYSGPAPLPEKIAGAAVIALILVCTWRLATRTVPGFVRGLRAGRADSWQVLLAGIAVVVSKSLDGIGRKLSAISHEIGAEVVVRASRIEEMLELVASMLLVMAVVLGRRIGWARQG